MKLFIFIAILAFNFFFVVNAMKRPSPSVCPEGMEWKLGPTWDCDNQVCRGIQPICIDETYKVMGCFCKNQNQSKDGDKCVTHCPLYP